MLLEEFKNQVAQVLILVLMEYGLGRVDEFIEQNAGRVLILVLMEYGLGRIDELLNDALSTS